MVIGFSDRDSVSDLHTRINAEELVQTKGSSLTGETGRSSILCKLFPCSHTSRRYLSAISGYNSDIFQ